VLCGKIGDCPKESLAAAGIVATDVYALEWIEEGIGHWYEQLNGQQEQRQSA
jgi:nitrogen fixation protein NifB